MKKSYNYKFIIGLILGLILVTGVYAVDTILSSDVVYDSTNSSLSSGDVQSAIDDLASKIEVPTSCPNGYYCEELKTTLSPGDYISYTPSSTSYTTDTTKTGYTSTQTINPSELNLWRVLSINDDGTVDIISENVSSTAVYFRGQTGYQNLVGYLNVLASQYETDGITVGSRHFGYDGQTEYITDTTYFASTTAPWTCSTGGTCSPDPDDYESSGGGDKGYLTDYNLVYNVLGTRVATNPSGTTKAYWMASRHYRYSGSTAWNFNGRLVSTSGSDGLYYLYRYISGTFSTNGNSSSLRPIVTLKSDLTYEGVGAEYYPMEIKGW